MRSAAYLTGCAVSLMSSCSGGSGTASGEGVLPGESSTYGDEGELIDPIPFSEIGGVSVGNAQDDKAKTGVTVFYFPAGATASAVVLGGGPASREVPLLDPARNTPPLDALVFGGGSAHGLAASDGVVACIEEHGKGYDTGYGLVPIVCQSDIFDLSYGDGSVRPDRKMGYLACERAMKGNSPQSGNIGAGTGATVGKPDGMLTSQKSGIGYAAAKIGDLKVGVAAVVNALGDIYKDGVKIGGMTTPDRKGFADASSAILRNQYHDLITGNTTLVAVFTNADFTVADLQKVADMASAGMPRAIRPVFTMADGDTVYALSVGEEKVSSDVNTVGVLASIIVEKAIADAVQSSRISEEEFLRNVR